MSGHSVETVIVQTANGKQFDLAIYQWGQRITLDGYIAIEIEHRKSTTIPTFEFTIPSI